MSAAAASFDLMMAPLEYGSLKALRRIIVGQAKGSVLELGAGTGVNLQYYDPTHVHHLTITDLEVWKDSITRKKRRLRSAVRHLIRPADVQNLPFDANSFDTVVFTLLFCSVENPHAGLREIYRVLRPGGTALFIEHVLPPSIGLAAPMHAITPAWRRVAGNCHLDRDTVGSIRRAGFSVQVTHSAARGIFVAGRAIRPTVAS